MHLQSQCIQVEPFWISELRLIVVLRGYARAYIKDVEKIRATAIIDIIHSGEQVFACQMNCSWKSFLHGTRTSRDMGTLRLFKIVVSLASSCIDTVAVILHLGWVNKEKRCMYLHLVIHGLLELTHFSSWQWVMRQKQGVLTREPVSSVATFLVRRSATTKFVQFDDQNNNQRFPRPKIVGVQGLRASGWSEQGFAPAWGWQE